MSIFLYKKGSKTQGKHFPDYLFSTTLVKHVDVETQTLSIWDNDIKATIDYDFPLSLSGDQTFGGTRFSYINEPLVIDSDGVGYISLDEKLVVRDFTNLQLIIEHIIHFYGTHGSGWLYDSEHHRLLWGGDYELKSSMDCRLMGIELL